MFYVWKLISNIASSIFCSIECEGKLGSCYSILARSGNCSYDSKCHPSVSCSQVHTSSPCLFPHSSCLSDIVTQMSNRYLDIQYLQESLQIYCPKHAPVPPLPCLDSSSLNLQHPHLLTYAKKSLILPIPSPITPHSYTQTPSHPNNQQLPSIVHQNTNCICSLRSPVSTPRSRWPASLASNAAMASTLVFSVQSVHSRQNNNVKY